MTSFFQLYKQWTLKVSGIFTREIRKKLLLIFLISSCIQSIVIFDVGAPFKLVHVVGVFLSPLLVLYPSKHKLNFKICALIVLLYLQTAISYTVYGISSWLLRMIFCTFTFVYTWWISDDFSLNDWFWIGTRAAIFVHICIFINLIINGNTIYQYLLSIGSAHPNYKSMFGGGANLDSTWLGLFVFLAVDSAWWPPMLIMTFLFSILLGSRAGFLTGIAFVLWVVVQWIRKKIGNNVKILFWSSWDRRKRVISILTSAFLLLSFIILQGFVFSNQIERQNDLLDESVSSEEDCREGVVLRGATSALFERFENMGDIKQDRGSSGRLNMWKWIPKELKENMWGYGLGNGIEEVRANSPESIFESNIHNIYFQVLLDQGIIGLIILFAIVIIFVWKEIPTLFENPLAAFLLCYLGLGMIQFRLLEVMFWFFVGGYTSLHSATKAIKKN